MFVPSDLIRLICNYIPLVELRSWINRDKINWDELSSNPNAILMLEKNQDKINWGYVIGKFKCNIPTREKSR